MIRIKFIKLVECDYIMLVLFEELFRVLQNNLNNLSVSELKELNEFIKDCDCL